MFPLAPTKRPLGFVTSRQEQIYIASQIISAVADCFIDYSSCGGLADTYELMELAGRLDVAIATIRQANGGSD